MIIVIICINPMHIEGYDVLTLAPGGTRPRGSRRRARRPAQAPAPVALDPLGLVPARHPDVPRHRHHAQPRHPDRGQAEAAQAAEFGAAHEDARPGGDAWLRIGAGGAAEYEITSRGAISWLNDLHKGRNTGAAWS